MNGRLNEKKKLMVHVYDRDMELTVSEEEEQCYIMAAKYVNKKIMLIVTIIICINPRLKSKTW